MPHLHTNCQNKSQKYMYCMTTAEYEKEHLEKIASRISQLHSNDCGHSSLHTCTCFKILQKYSHSHSTPKSRYHNQFFFFQTSFYPCFLNELLLTVFQIWHSSNFEVKIGLNYCNIFVQQLRHYCYNVGKYQYNVSQQAGKVAGSFGFNTK